jgi:hypothetical protein
MNFMLLSFLSILLSCSFVNEAIDSLTTKESNDQLELVQPETEQLESEKDANNPTSNTTSNIETDKQQNNDVDELSNKQPDYLFPSGEIDCQTSCSNYLTRQGGYPDFIKNHFDNLGNKAMNECYQSAISQGKSVTDLNCKEKAIQACIKNCEGSKPMEWRTRSRSDLQ